MTKGGENPAFVVYNDESSNGEMVYTLWIGGKVLLAYHPDGPFNVIEGFGYPGGNPAPIYHNGAFYMTNQGTTQVCYHVFLRLVSCMFETKNTFVCQVDIYYSEA